MSQNNIHENVDGKADETVGTQPFPVHVILSSHSDQGDESDVENGGTVFTQMDIGRVHLRLSSRPEFLELQPNASSSYTNDVI